MVGKGTVRTTAETQQAHEHDAWFRAEVEATLVSVADGSARLIDEREWRAAAKGLRARLEGTAGKAPR